MTTPLYPSGAGSLFSIIARADASTPKSTEPVVITCPWCLSEDTHAIKNEYDIFECTNCGETFTRPHQMSTYQNADLDE